MEPSSRRGIRRFASPNDRPPSRTICTCCACCAAITIGELKTPTPLIFGAISIDLPGVAVNLLDSAGLLAFGGQTFTGDDATFRVLSSIDDLTDGTGNQAPAVGITLLPAGDAAAASLASPTMQGSPVMIWVGAVKSGDRHRDPRSAASIPRRTRRAGAP